MSEIKNEALTTQELDAIRELALSPQAVALDSLRDNDESPDRVVEEYAELARQLNAPSRCWCLEGERGVLKGAALRLLSNSRPNTTQAARRLIELGGTVWFEWIRLTGGEAAASWISPDVFKLLAFSHWDEENRSVAFKSALSEGSSRSMDLLESVARMYWEAAPRTSKTAKGVLGPQDETALSLCKTLLASESEIRGLCKKMDDAGAIEALLADAHERFRAKSAPLDPGFDPRKIREAINAQGELTVRNRILALGEMMSRCSDDEEFTRGALRVGGWLEGCPQLACMRMGSRSAEESRSTLMGTAIQSRSRAGLEELERIGANIWLAAAQEGNPNACEWVLKRLIADIELNAPHKDIYARMLLNGAWLTGEESPINACLEMSRRLIESHDGDEPAQTMAVELLSAMEEVELNKQTGPLTAAAAKKRASL